MSNQRWTADKNIQFISVYKHNECLWDPKHPQYKNMPARVAAYKMIMRAMEMSSVKDVVTKIRVLRNTYNNEMLKAKKLNSLSTTTEPYVSKIPWLPHLDFLKNIDTNARESYGIPIISQETPIQPTQPIPVPVTDEAPPVQRVFRRNIRKIRDPFYKAVDVLDKISRQTSSREEQPAPSRDEFDLFGQTVAEQLRQLPLETALETEEMILSTIRRQRIKEVKVEPTTP